MNYVVGFFRVLKYIFGFLLYFLLLGVLFMRLLEWGLAYAVVQPKAEDIAYELTTYVEANEVRLTDEVLKGFMDSWNEDGYINDNEEVTIRYIQYAQDKRFKVHVTVSAQFWDQPIRADGRSEVQGINWDEPPGKTVYGHYPSHSDEEDSKKAAVAESQEVVVHNEEANIANALTAESEKHGEQMPQTEKISHESIRSFMEHYVTAGLAAIDYNEFSMVEDLLDPNGKAFKESKNYIKHMNEIGMQQELLEMEVIQISPFNEEGFRVVTTEEYRIIDSEHTVKIKRYESEYHLVLMDEGKLAMRELLRTDLLSSAEVDGYVGGNTDSPMEDIIQLGADPYVLYQQSCAGCHGNNYEGVSGPPLINVNSYMSEEEVKDIIRYGRGNMPSGMLDESQVEAMAAFLMELY